MKNILTTYQETKEARGDMKKTIYLDKINVPIRLKTMESFLKTHFENENIIIHYNNYFDKPPFSLPPIFISKFIFEKNDEHFFLGSEEEDDYDYTLRIDCIGQIYLVTKGIPFIAGHVIRIFFLTGEYLDIEQNSGY